MGPIIESPDQGFFGVLSDGEGPMIVVKFDSNGKKSGKKNILRDFIRRIRF